PRGEAERGDIRPAIAFVEERRRPPGGMIARMRFGLGQQDAGMGRQLRGDARARDPRADHGNVEILGHRGHVRSRNSSMAARARSRTGSASRRISWADSASNHWALTWG